MPKLLKSQDVKPNVSSKKLKIRFIFLVSMIFFLYKMVAIGAEFAMLRHYKTRLYKNIKPIPLVILVGG